MASPHSPSQAIEHTVQQVQQLAQTVAQLKAQQQPAPRSAALPKLAPPASYSGRGTPTLEAFKREVTAHCEWYGLETDALKVRYASMFLKDAAADWWSSVDQATSVAWADFFARLEARFVPITSAETARTKLDALAQGPKQSVHDYIMAFRALLVHLPNMDEGDRLHRFLRGLRASTAAQLRIQGVTTLDKAIDMAARVGQLGEAAAAAVAARTGGSSSAAGGGPAPMEIDALFAIDESADPDEEVHLTRKELNELLAAIRVHRGDASKYQREGGATAQRPLPKIPHLTEAQVKQRMRNKQCFGCGDSSHMSRHCNKRRVAADGMVTWDQPK